MTADSNNAPKPIPPAPITHTRRRLSPVWIIPIVAALIGLWLVWQHYAAQGPLIYVRFETANGVDAKKTAVQCRSVRVGVVDSVKLAPDLKSVVATIRIDGDAADLLRSDTRFWVVRPRVGGAGISGLGTLVSGTYIELDPGAATEVQHHFDGLESPPVTPQGVPGLHVTLVGDKAGSIGIGSSISYRGIKVGRIESQLFNSEKGRLEFGAFIGGDFGKLISPRTRFWNVSGIDLDIDADGVRLRTGTLESLVSGGVAFDTVSDGTQHEQAPDGTVFSLFNSFDDTKETTLNPRLTYLLLFKESVRGLSPKAPVEFRGVRVGTVMGISFDYLPTDPERRVPVLIKIDPSLIAHLPDGDVEQLGRELIAKSVHGGLRATLRTGSILTGQLFVDLAPHEDAPPAEVAEIGGYQVLPTISTGLGQLQDKVTAVLDKIQNLKIEETVEHASSALVEIKSSATELKKVVASLDKLLGSEETQGLPKEIKASLDEVRKTLAGFNDKSTIYKDVARTLEELGTTLRSIESLATTLERKPSSLIWGNPKGTVVPPKGKP
jgi:paraquat-inducible protein B